VQLTSRRRAARLHRWPLAAQGGGAQRAAAAAALSSWLLRARAAAATSSVLGDASLFALLRPPLAPAPLLHALPAAMPSWAAGGATAATTTAAVSGAASTGGRDAMRVGALARFQAKRTTRTFAKTIRYGIRKLAADARPRAHGRFARPAGAEAAPTAAAAKAPRSRPPMLKLNLPKPLPMPPLRPPPAAVTAAAAAAAQTVPPAPAPPVTCAADVRAAALARFRSKRATRSFAKTIRYEQRAREATTRARNSGGRFTKKQEEGRGGCGGGAADAPLASPRGGVTTADDATDDEAA
jgi:hypothetical protein